MSDLDTLKKIIPPDEAVANKALAYSLQQVKKVFNTDLEELAPVVATLETNAGLDLIQNLNQPLPSDVANVYSTNLATGTGPGNTVTTMDVIGVAAGYGISNTLPVVTTVINDLANIGALNVLTANGGSNTSATNGIYTTMQYTLAGDYTTVTEVTPPAPPDPGVYEYTITIPAPLPGSGIYGPFSSATEVYDAAFANLINLANNSIVNIASTYSDYANTANEATDAMSNRLAINVTNCTAAGIDIGNLVANISNANLIANSTSTVLTFTSQLQELGLNVREGGTAQFLESVANLDAITGQAVVSSMREGRNIERLNQIGILLDTQVPAVTIPGPVANLLPG
jgi:hypothetical protein